MVGGASASEQALGFADPGRGSENTFDFDFNKKMNRALGYKLATAAKHSSAVEDRGRLSSAGWVGLGVFYAVRQEAGLENTGALSRS